MIREALERIGAEALPVEAGRWASVTPDDADLILLSRTAVPHLERASSAEIETRDGLNDLGLEIFFDGGGHSLRLWVPFRLR